MVVVEGFAVMFTVMVRFKAGQSPFEAKEYVTTLEPGVEVEGLISPVTGLMDKPADPEKVPPVVPTRVTAPEVTELQKGVPA